MKIRTAIAVRKSQSGFAVVIMLILLAMVLGFIMANSATLSTLHKDVQRIEQRQIRRLNSLNPQISTNTPAAAAVPQ